MFVYYQMNIEKSTRVHKIVIMDHRRKITQTKSIYINAMYVTLHAHARTCVHNKIWDEKKSVCTICRDIHNTLLILKKNKKQNDTVLCTLYPRRVRLKRKVERGDLLCFHIVLYNMLSILLCFLKIYFDLVPDMCLIYEANNQNLTFKYPTSQMPDLK